MLIISNEQLNRPPFRFKLVEISPDELDCGKIPLHSHEVRHRIGRPWPLCHLYQHCDLLLFG